VNVKEIFYSIQGEGFNTGRAAVFCRFTGCNLWSGLEEDRSSAICTFCDTDFRDGMSISEDRLVDEIVGTWGRSSDLYDCANSIGAGGRPFVVFTGGEPGLQLTESLIHKMRVKGFDVAVETNGTVILPDGVFWITVSPKFGSVLKQTFGHELKLVYPQDFDLGALERLDFNYYYLQPMAGFENSTKLTLQAILKNPVWRLSIQTHKITGVR